ncbi:MAG: transporter [Porticoccus sp.]|nr:transporter [Porticoccus sp.]MBQ0806567.1 transporter [Porticoccus sp.]
MENLYRSFAKIAVLAYLSILPMQAMTMDLNEIIPSLYGGDGVTLWDTHSTAFTQASLEDLQGLSETLSDFSQPSLSSIVGLTFEFDPILDEFVPTTTTQSLGSSLTERPQTVGKGVFTFSIAYGHTKFSELDGHSLDSLTLDLGHSDPPPGALTCLAPGFPNPPPDNCYSFLDDVARLTLKLDITQQFINLSTSYGLTENVDIGFHIPIIHTKVSASSVASIVNDPSIIYSPLGGNGSLHGFDPINGDDPVSSASGSHTGMGDFFIHAKHHFYDSDKLNLGSLFQVRLPTGDEDNLQGIEDVGGKAMLLADATFPLNNGSLTPYLNAGIAVNTSNSGQDKLMYNVGLEYDVIFGEHHTSASIDFMGRNTITNKSDSGEDIYDLGLGIKYALTKRGSVYANIILPINDSGLRPDVTYIFGFTWTK